MHPTETERLLARLSALRSSKPEHEWEAKPVIRPAPANDPHHQTDTRTEK